ncbi:MAG: hypothetical protein R3C14_22555 [Caldilineaceae bacterium]
MLLKSDVVLRSDNQRVAMKSGTTVNWLLGDYLGSTAYTINGATETGEVRYYAWGKERYIV